MARNSEQSWYQKAAQLLARGECSNIQQAVLLLELPINTKEAEGHFKSRAFQEVLRTERARFFSALANNPEEHNKRTAVGKLIHSAQKLMDAGAFDKAAEVLHKICKIEGWDKSAAEATIFAGLTQKDLDIIKQKLTPQEIAPNAIN